MHAIVFREFTISAGRLREIWGERTPDRQFRSGFGLGPARGRLGPRCCAHIWRMASPWSTRRPEAERAARAVAECSDQGVLGNRALAHDGAGDNAFELFGPA